MQLLSKAIYEILSADADITGITGSGNIWHAKLPQRTIAGSDEPVELGVYFYTYAVQPYDTKSGAAETDAHMLRVCIVGNDDADMYAVGKYIRYALDRIPEGWYDDVYIQGSKFLNASFDPEGNYELEVQEWVLEFQVRVIDNDIRGVRLHDMANIRTKTIELTSAQIKSLYATPIVVIPGEAGKVVSIYKTVASYTFGTVEYDDGGNVLLRDELLGNTLIASVISGSSLGGAASLVTNAIAIGGGGLLGSGGGVVMTNGTSAFTNGDGTLKVIITYQMVSI